MRRKTRVLFRAAVLLVVLASACGGHKSSSTTSATTRPVTTSFKPAFKTSFAAPTHHPVVNKNWPITVTVTDLAGKPIAASLHMRVLFSGSPVGQIDADKKGRGKVYHFVGRHHENITWPVASIGYSLTLQAIVTAKGQTQKLAWPIKVVPK